MIVNVSRETKPLVIAGAGGHSRVLHALALAIGYRIIGICDPVLTKGGCWNGIEVLGGDDAFEGLDPCDIEVVNGIGQLPGNLRRRQLYEKLKAIGFHFPVLVHPTAWVAEGVVLEEGVQVMAGAIIQPGCRIGSNTTINTQASIDHDTGINAHVHIAPGVTVCGGVSIGEGVFVGAGAVVVQGVTVGREAIVGAGTVLVRSLCERGTALGAKTRYKANAT